MNELRDIDTTNPPPAPTPRRRFTFSIALTICVIAVTSFQAWKWWTVLNYEPACETAPSVQLTPRDGWDRA